jgi:hypothetical protein
MMPVSSANFSSCFKSSLLRFMLGLTVPLFVCANARCQTHAVYVDDDQGKAKAVANALKAKIGGTTRYVLVGEAYSTESNIKILCLEEDRGYFCSYAVSFWSPQTSPLQLEGTSGIATGTVEYIAEMLFEIFVMESSDEKIAAAVKHKINAISVFCEQSDHKSPCRQK